MSTFLSKILALGGYWLLFHASLSAQPSFSVHEIRDGVGAFYEMRPETGKLGVKYFAVRAYDEYQKWKSDKEVLLLTTGAFSNEWEENAKPIGLCLDQGRVLNRVPVKDMDALVVIENKGDQLGEIRVIDLDHDLVSATFHDGSELVCNPRDGSLFDRIKFISIAEKEQQTIFQTQLLYSRKYGENFGDLDYGNKAERRFLVIGRKNGRQTRIVVDLPQPEKLNRAAHNAVDALREYGVSIDYLLNLDTGNRNLLYVNEGKGLQKIIQSDSQYGSLERSTNLLVFYRTP